jgi:hypothetical protein
MDAVVFFVGTKQPDREADHTPASSAEIKKRVWLLSEGFQVLPVCLRSTNKV